MEKEFPKVLSYVHPTKKIAVVKFIRDEGEAEDVFYQFEREFGFDIPYSVDQVSDLIPDRAKKRLIGFARRNK